MATVIRRGDPKGIASGTVNRYMSGLSTLLGVAQRRYRWTGHNLCREIDREKEPQSRGRALTVSSSSASCWLVGRSDATARARDAVRGATSTCSHRRRAWPLTAWPSGCCREDLQLPRLPRPTRGREHRPGDAALFAARPGAPGLTLRWRVGAIPGAADRRRRPRTAPGASVQGRAATRSGSIRSRSWPRPPSAARLPPAPLCRRRLRACSSRWLPFRGSPTSPVPQSCIRRPGLQRSPVSRSA